MQAVGQFDKDGTDVVMQRVEHLLEVFHLLGRFILHFFLFRHDSDQVGDIGTKTCLYIIECKRRIFGHVVQKRSNHRIRPQLQFFGHNPCHCYRMYNIGCTTFTFLSGMSLSGKLERFPNAYTIFGRHITPVHYGQNAFQLSVD